MSPDAGAGMTRRQALLLTAAGAVSAGIGVTGVLRGGLSTSRSSARQRANASGELVQPEVVASAAGVLQVRLRAAAGSVDIAGRTVQALSYNGSVPGPTLRLRAGDRVQLDLENRLGAATNLHLHGLHVTPEGNGDNPFIHIKDGETFRYEYAVPDDHPAGTFWYHPHLHGRVADQLWGGLAGAIIVERDDEVPLPSERERLLVITDVTFDGDAVAKVGMPEQMMGREGELVLVNGQQEPNVTVDPGGFERWRIVNACTSRFLRLRLDAGELVQVAGDRGPLAEPRQVDDLLLATGNRAELLARVPQPGDHQLIGEPADRGATGMGPMMRGGKDEPVTLLRIKASGTTRQGSAVPKRLAQLEDLRARPVNATRTLTFAMGMGGGMGMGMSFTIDGKEFDPERVDSHVRLGDVEEWTIRNDSPMDHPFHLHVWPMQVLDRGDRSVDGVPEWADVVKVPARGAVTVRVLFADFAGRTVYHCHILDHEDQGMMGVVQAV